jgi:hypothetical protein
MKCNVGGTDRNIRLALGSFLVPLSMCPVVPKAWRWVSLGLGLTALTTALTRYCPANQAIGLNTCGRGNEQP